MDTFGPENKHKKIMLRKIMKDPTVFPAIIQVTAKSNDVVFSLSRKKLIKLNKR